MAVKRVFRYDSIPAQPPSRPAQKRSSRVQPRVCADERYIDEAYYDGPPQLLYHETTGAALPAHFATSREGHFATSSEQLAMAMAAGMHSARRAERTEVSF